MTNTEEKKYEAIKSAVYSQSEWVRVDLWNAMCEDCGRDGSRIEDMVDFEEFADTIRKENGLMYLLEYINDMKFDVDKRYWGLDGSGKLVSFNDLDDDLSPYSFADIYNWLVKSADVYGVAAINDYEDDVIDEFLNAMFPIDDDEYTDEYDVLREVLENLGYGVNDLLAMDWDELVEIIKKEMSDNE